MGGRRAYDRVGNRRSEGMGGMLRGKNEAKSFESGWVKAARQFRESEGHCGRSDSAAWRKRGEDVRVNKAITMLCKPADGLHLERDVPVSIEIGAPTRQQDDSSTQLAKEQKRSHHIHPWNDAMVGGPMVAYTAVSPCLVRGF